MPFFTWNEQRMRHRTPSSAASPKYHVEISPVAEVTLLGAANLSFWQEKLEREGLLAASRDGQAQVLIIAADARFKGVRFRELSISILVGGIGKGGTQDAVYLCCAYNSLGLFAFVERKVFHTPYYRGAVRVIAQGAASLAVDDGYGGALQGAMSVDDFASRVPLVDQYHGWEGPIFLPALKPGSGAGKKLFFAKLGGHTRTYAFDPACDQLTIRPSKRHPIFAWLSESEFAAQEWILRPSGTHAKSKTVLRTNVGLQAIPV